jgi:hypothetical protein
VQQELHKYLKTEQFSLTSITFTAQRFSDISTKRITTNNNYQHLQRMSYSFLSTYLFFLEKGKSEGTVVPVLL